MSAVYRILLIDDSPDDRSDLRQMLLRGSTSRYHFSEAELGSTALQMVGDQQQALTGRMPFDCILLDFHLPDMDAYEVLEALCGGRDMPPCPVVVVTGWQGADKEDGARLLRAGAQDYIGKSWTTPESLNRTIENSIERFDLQTRRKIAETQFHESEERYRNLFNSIDDGLCVIEKIAATDGKPPDFRYVDTNPAFSAQSGMTDVIGKTIRQMLPDESEEWFASYNSVYTTGIPIRFERSNLIPGHVHELNAFRIGGIESLQVAIIFRDITERRRSELQTLAQSKVLADLDRRKDEFLAMLSHELRNPLAPISNAVQLLRLQKSDNPVQIQACAVIERQVGQLNRLVNDLLEVSRITTGLVQLRQAQVSLGDIVDRAVETAQPLITQRGHKLSVLMLPPQPVWLHADAARLEQVIVNLLTNAAKYTNEGGQILLTVQQEGFSAVLRVRDTGIGIAPALLPHVFELFTQAERALDRSQGGLGIGLCLVQRLVELHGGTVVAHSVLGQGSEFVVRLPIMLTLDTPLLTSLKVLELPDKKFCRVLVVDDNVDAAETLVMLLEFLGHTVQMAHNGAGALQLALDWKPDVVLLDIGLPGMNGYEVAKRIREDASLAGMVLVALTGYGQESDRMSAHEAGFNYHLAKPADFTMVESILDAVSDKAAADLAL
ncbi:MAG: hybrid sensor histidine kinase/response regulator [Polaromonas sp.]|jgi:PAS domain S-box-containing protein|nr:hybrid sensor histidine kinase/response regulator [Polaromonas sp.]